MFANFFQLFGRRPDDDYEKAFVKEINVTEAPVRSTKVERVIFGGWLLIALKSAVVWWACTYYAVPINPLWIIAPTVAFGLLCTFVYYGRR